MADDEDKKYDPTPQRREQFRKQGQVARSRDAAGIASTLAAIGVVVATRPIWTEAVSNLFTRCLGAVSAPDRTTTATQQTAVVALMALVVPVALAATIGGLVATVAQVGMHIETDGLGFNVERLNPWPRFARLFTPGPAITELIMSTARVGVVGYFAWRALQDEIPALLRLADLPPGAALGASARALGAVVLRVLFALGVLAVLDYLYSWFSLEKRMKMSLKEIKEESRSQEGDPKVKAKLRSKARALAKQRMMASVKRADVIVTNPTHYAVALRYSPKDPAPIVVAKGVDEVALQIRKEARKYGIPILESRALARALHADVAIGKAVPGAHFVAVARILAFVYRLRPRKAPRSA